MFFSISALVVLLYVKIDRENKIDMFRDSVTSEASIREPLEKGALPGRTIEQPAITGSATDPIKRKLKFFIINHMVEQFHKDVYSGIEWLTKIAENDMTVSPYDKYMKCLPHGALGWIPGDRVELAYPIGTGKTVSIALEGGDICKSHSNLSVIAQYAIGTIYQYGKGIPKNIDKAFIWYKKASENGFPLADFSLGAMCQTGEGVKQSHKEAFGFYRKAADQGLSIAQDSLGDMYYYGEYVEQNHTEAVKWYRKAAEQGYIGAQNNLGIMYDNGYGVQVDDAEAIKWYRKAADRNNANAQYNLGNLYADLDRPQHDFNKAIKWFRKAAESGHAPSQKSLGIIFQMGRGTAEPNYAEAAKWYRAATEQGDPEAMAYLGYLYEHGLGVGQDTIKAKDFYFAAAQKSNAEDLFSMGMGWAIDDSRPNDNAMACIWYQLAAHKGKKSGSKSCFSLRKQMTAAQITQVEDTSRQLIEKLD
jgi:TPR repeat protein